jgi:arsenate reductase (glutaredoxin)
MALQIFGTKKCSVTRKAERFFKERGVRYQLVDLAEKGISAGELASVASAVGRDALLDPDSALYKKKGLAYIDADPEQLVIEDPLLLRTPVVRDGRHAVIGDRPDEWAAMIAANRGA